MTRGNKLAAKAGSQNCGKLGIKRKPKPQKGGMTDDDDSDDEEPQLSKKSLIKPGNPGKAPTKKNREANKDDISDDDPADEGALLASTREENPHVRGGQPYETDQEGTFTPNFPFTGFQRDRRRLTLRNRIAPHPITSEQIETHLFATGWDVDRAYHRWHAEHMQALAAIGRGELIRPSFNVRVRPGGDQPEEEVDGEGSSESATTSFPIHMTQALNENDGDWPPSCSVLSKRRVTWQKASRSEGRRPSCC